MVPPLESMTYDDVTEVYRKEQRSKNITEVRKDFYPALRECLDGLKKVHEKEMSLDPYSAKAMSLSNQMKKISEKSMQIYEFRMEKILLMALRSSGGAKVDTSRLTDEEKDLFEQISRNLRLNRDLLTEGERKENKLEEPEGRPIAEEKVQVEVIAEQTPPVKEPAIVVTAPDVPSIPVPETITAAQVPPSEYVLLRILEDIPPFAGPDRNYVLHKEDVVTIPSSIARVLIGKKRAVAVQAPVELGKSTS